MDPAGARLEVVSYMVVVNGLRVICCKDQHIKLMQSELEALGNMGCAGRLAIVLPFFPPLGCVLKREMFIKSRIFPLGAYRCCP